MTLPPTIADILDEQTVADLLVRREQITAQAQAHAVVPGSPQLLSAAHMAEETADYLEAVSERLKNTGGFAGGEHVARLANYARQLEAFALQDLENLHS
jgi:hypothetical protein